MPSTPYEQAGVDPFHVLDQQAVKAIYHYILVTIYRLSDQSSMRSGTVKSEFLFQY